VGALLLVGENSAQYGSQYDSADEIAGIVMAIVPIIVVVAVIARAYVTRGDVDALVIVVAPAIIVVVTSTIIMVAMVFATTTVVPTVGVGSRGHRCNGTQGHSGPNDELGVEKFHVLDSCLIYRRFPRAWV
jgi:hypothetical protein